MAVKSTYLGFQALCICKQQAKKKGEETCSPPFFQTHIFKCNSNRIITYANSFAILSA